MAGKGPERCLPKQLKVAAQPPKAMRTSTGVSVLLFAWNALSAGYGNKVGECTRARHGITVSTSGQPDQSRISARFEDILCTLKRRWVIERTYPYSMKAPPPDINRGNGHRIFPPFAVSSLL